MNHEEDLSAEAQFVRRLLKSAPRRAMPADLAAAIEAKLSRRAPWAFLRLPLPTRVWAPAGALALATLAIGVWFRTLDRDPDQYVPLEPLLAAHSRYTAESLLPEDNLVAASYTAYSAADAQDADSE